MEQNIKIWKRANSAKHRFVGGGIFLICGLGTYSTSIWGFPLISIAYGFLVLGAISPSSFLYKWNSGFTTLIATLSYAMYLSHKGVIHSAGIAHKIRR